MSEIKVNMENLKENEREQLLALIEKANEKPSKRFKPKKDDIYWFINSYGGVMHSSCYNPSTDLGRYKFNNCFATEEEAKFEAERRKVVAELEIFALENNDEIDWENCNQGKHYISYIYEDNVLNTLNSAWTCRNLREIFFSSRELCEQAIEKVGEGRIKKYLFEVEEV